ncbi:hypothetical protein OIU77_022953 [Salix suchowensis]|uniref:Uncharacterized protein n=1 Tax=Salix suchowensis TaxID=1278906 RepID=A0ABQ9C254_9ROSI|nr:hypothetical protein OIU77_022953 [Salix suchowensis]
MSLQGSKAKTTATILKMIFFLKSLSRSVHDQEHHHEPVAETKEVETKISTDGKRTLLTVWRKSLLISCNGFTVFNSCGDLVYRVDNYIDRPEELVLMDGSGKSILTMRRRKKLGVRIDSWLVYEGSSDKRPSFVVEGSYTHRSCEVLDGSRKVLAEIKRKEAIVGGVSYGVEVFLLNVEPGFDPGFAMGLVLVLDQIFS